MAKAKANTNKAKAVDSTNDVATMLQALMAELASVKAELASVKAAPAADTKAPVKAKAKDAAKAKAKAEHKSRKAAFDAAREAWSELPWEKALDRAAAEIKANRKAKAVTGCKAKDIRQWLTSESNQGLMACRAANDVRFNTMIAALESRCK